MDGRIDECALAGTWQELKQWHAWKPAAGWILQKGCPPCILFLFEECHGVVIRAATRAFHGMEVGREERGSMVVANIELILFWQCIDITAMTGGDESPGILRASLRWSCYHGFHLAP